MDTLELASWMKCGNMIKMALHRGWVMKHFMRRTERLCSTSYHHGTVSLDGQNYLMFQTKKEN
jgi:hypothetical protein